MKPRFRTAILPLVIALTSHATANPLDKAAIGSDLTAGASWDGGIVPGSGDVATWITGSLGGALTIGSNLSWQGIDIQDATAAITTSGAGILTLGTSGITLATGGVDLTLGNAIALGTPQIWNIGDDCTLTADGILSGTGALTLNGNSTGSIVLNGANTHSGGTTLTAGTLTLGHVNALQNSVLFTGSSGTREVVFGVVGTNTYNLRNLSGALNLNIEANSLTIAAGNDIPAYTGTITGTGGITVNGGRLAIGGTQAYTGTTDIQGGHLEVAGSALELSQSVLNIGAGADTTRAVDIWAGNFTVRGLTGGTNDTRIASNNSRTLIINTPAEESYTYAGRIQNGTWNTGSVLSLTKSGAGTQTLSGTNTFTGTTTINGGVLALDIASGGQLYRTGSFFGVQNQNYLIINPGGTFQTWDWNYGANRALAEMRNNYGQVLLNGGTIRFDDTFSAVRAFTVGGNGGTIHVTEGNTYTKSAGTTGGDNIIRFSAASTLTVAGAGDTVIADALGAYGNTGFSIAKSGTGTLTLTGNNSYTGGTTVNDGLIRIGGSGLLGSGAVSIAADATLHFDSTANQTLTAALTGDGELLKSNTGNLTIAGNAIDFTGDTTVTGGRLTLTNIIGGDVTIGDGATLAGDGIGDGTLTMQEGSTLAIAGGDPGFAILFEQVVLEDEAFVQFTSAPITGETYDVIEYGVGGLTGFGNLVARARGTLNDDSANNKITFTATAGETRTWNTGSGIWNAEGILENWLEGDKIYLQGDHVVFGDITEDTAITLEGPIGPGSVTIQNTTDTYTFTGTAIEGSAALSKSGAGDLFLATANTYSGGTTLTGGTLTLGNAGSLGTGEATVASGTTLNLAGFSAANAFNLSGNGNGTNPALWNSGGNATLNGTITLDADATVGHSATSRSNRLSLNSLDLNGSKLSITTGAVSIDVRRIPTGNIDILDGATLYSENGGALASATGTITIHTGGRMETRDTNNTAMTAVHDIVLNGGTLSRAVITDNNGGGAGTTLRNNISVDATNGGTITNNVGGFPINMSLSGSLAGSGPLALNGGQGVVFRGDTSAYTGTLTATAGNLIFNPNADTSFGGTIAGTRPLTKQGANTLTLTTANTYTGGTELQGGTLRVNGISSIGTGYLAVKNGAIFDYRGTGSESTTRTFWMDLGAANIHIHEASADLTLNPSGGNRNQAFTKTGPGALTISGTAFSGGASVTLDGGVLTLTGNSTYTGATTITEGTLAVTGSLGNTSVTVEENATLAGNGNLGGSVTIKSGATHALAVAATDDAQITRTIGGSLTLDPGNILALTADTAPADGTYILATATGGIIGALDTVNLGAGITGNVTIVGNDLVLTVTGTADPFDTWAAANGLDGTPGKEAGFNDDPDGDGVANGLEWILGGNPLDGQSGGLITTTATAAAGLTLNFTRNPDSIGEATLMVEYNTDLGAAWESATIGATSSSEANGVEITISAVPTPDSVTINIPATNSDGGKLFARLSAEQTIIDN